MISFAICKHTFGEVQEDGWQYCEKCGAANRPINEQKECVHKWESTEAFPTFNKNGMMIGKTWVQTCIYCGDMKSFSSK